jgi:hypothetical protein
MQKRYQREMWILGLTALIIVSLACNLSNPQGPEEPTPEVVTIDVTTIQVPPAGAPDEGEQGASAVFKQDLNVQSGPGTVYPVQDQLPGGTKVDILGKNETGT